MITKIPPRVQNLFHLIRYVTEKPGAREISSSLPPGSPRDQARRIEDLARRFRPRMDRVGKHMILAFPPGEELPVSELRPLVRKYLSGMGYADAPHLAYLHTDTAHPHVHIVTTPVSFHGEPVSESWDWRRSEEVAREIERRWNLRPVPSSPAAQHRAPPSEELHAVARTGEASLREEFRRTVEEAAWKARTFDELTSALESRGISVQARFDRQGALRGLAFRRGEVHFRGSQLGRSFSGNRILAAFGLSSAEAPGAGRSPGRDSVTAGRAEVPMPSESRSLPPGSYDMAWVPSARLNRSDQHIGRNDATGVRVGVPEERIAEAVNRLPDADGAQQLLVRPHAENRTSLAFRGLTQRQVNLLARDGFEPQWFIKHGSRFDILLQTHEKLSREESWVLRKSLESRYSLPRHRGVFVDAVRAPGPADASDPGRWGQLIYVSDEPFPASGQAVWEAQVAARRQAVLDASVGAVPEPEAAALPAAVREVEEGFTYRLSPSPPLAAWEESFQAQLPAPAPSPDEPLAELTNDALLLEAKRANQALIELARDQPELDLTATEPGRRLLKLEGEIYRRGQEAADALAGAENRLTEAFYRLDDLVASGQQLPDAEKVDSYQRALRSLGVLQDEHRRAEVAYYTFECDKAGLHRTRFAAGVVEAPTPERADTLAELVQRYVELDRRSAAVEISPSIGPNASEAALEDHLRESRQRVEAALERLLAGEPRAIDAYQQAVSERFITERFLEARQLHNSVEGSRDQVGDLYSLERHREQLARLGAAESAITPEGAEPRERLLNASKRVARGDFSSESLRRLNGEIVASDRTDHLVMPLFPEKARTTQELLQRFQEVRQEVTKLAREVAQSGEPSPEKLARLFQASSEAVLLHQRFDQLHRQVLKLADPGKPPAGVSKQAWIAGWLRLAQNKGLTRPQAVSQILNAGQVTSGLGMVGGLGTSLGMRALSQVTSLALRHAREVLER